MAALRTPRSAFLWFACLKRGARASRGAFGCQGAEAIDWLRAPTRARLADRAPLYEWFCDAGVSTCWNAVDRHVEAGRGDQLAIIHDSPITHSTKGITYRELRYRVASLAGALRAESILHQAGRSRELMFRRRGRTNDQIYLVG